MTQVIGRSEHLSPIPDGTVRTLSHGRVDLQTVEMGGKEILLWQGKEISLPEKSGHTPRTFVNASWFMGLPQLRRLLVSFEKPAEGIGDAG